MKTRTYSRTYVGVSATAREVFRSATPPTDASHGTQYSYVIGPFRTKRAAVLMAEHGAGWLTGVAHAERAAATLANQSRMCREAMKHIKTGR